VPAKSRAAQRFPADGPQPDTTAQRRTTEFPGALSPLERIPTHIRPPYGTLAAHVAEHEVALDGPLREYYLVGPAETADQDAWRTEVGRPGLATRPTA